MVERTNWNVAKCTESFDSCEEALSYMSSHSFDGMILEREDDTFTAVCPTYPDGFYPDAKIIKKVSYSESHSKSQDNCCPEPNQDVKINF